MFRAVWYTYPACRVRTHAPILKSENPSVVGWLRALCMWTYRPSNRGVFSFARGSRMTTRPWMKFYTTDWRAAADLGACSYAAKGLWIDALCLMHLSPRRGYLLATNGTAIDVRELARLTFGKEAEVAILLAELEQAGVFSRDAGVVVCRRMVREEAVRIEAQVNGKRGGNPALKGVNPTVNPVNPNTHNSAYAPSGVWHMGSGSNSSQTPEGTKHVQLAEIAEETAPQIDPRLQVMMDVGIPFGVAQKIIREHNTPIDLLTEYVAMASEGRVTNRAAYVRAAIAGGYAPRQRGGKTKEELHREEQQAAAAIGFKNAMARHEKWEASRKAKTQ